MSVPTRSAALAAGSASVLVGEEEVVSGMRGVSGKILIIGSGEKSRDRRERGRMNDRRLLRARPLLPCLRRGERLAGVGRLRGGVALAERSGQGEGVGVLRAAGERAVHVSLCLVAIARFPPGIGDLVGFVGSQRRSQVGGR